jgi:2-polyprenyl-3-methyl-5-hydroxy-6-metoxy-1,4-benzoquinol methylase
MAAPPNPALIFDLLQAHQKTAALRAAIELDLFRAIGEGPGDTASLAKQCGASERGIRILCDFLTINEVLVKEDGRYQHSALSGMFLDPRSPASLASMAQFLGNPAMRDPYDRLAEVIRQGHTTLPGDGTVEPDNPVWVQFAETMAPMMRPMTGPLAAAVLEGSAGPVRVLDIAAGHGLYGIEIAKMNPEARVTGQDWAAVLEVAERNAREAGVEDRYERLPGSAFDVEFGGPYDAVLLTNFLHHFDHATCVGLLKKVRAALAPGGKVATLEFVPNEDRVSPPIPAAFALTMLASTAAGNAYTLSELTKMYDEAGFHDVTARPVQTGPQTIVLGLA